MSGIGRMSRDSGLTVSALRFYDGAGLLCPAHVDPQSGYRFYAPEQVAAARLVALLRRVGIPLAGIRAVLERRDDPAAVDALLAAHVRRLEQGLDDARRALSTVPMLLDPWERPVTVTVPAPALAAALRAVRFAVGSDPELPGLCSVLFDGQAGTLTLVATDRYRLALAPVPIPDGPAFSAVVPVDLADEIGALLTGAGSAEITVADGSIAVRAGDAEVTGGLRPDAFPDHRRLVAGDGPAAVPFDADALRAVVATAPARTSTRPQDGVEFAVVELAAGPDGVSVARGGVGVNREFLLEAIDAGGGGQLALGLDGPVAPLVIRSPGSLSLLMPVRPHQPGPGAGSAA
jgi:DNA polymerase III subunit beta